MSRNIHDCKFYVSLYCRSCCKTDIRSDYEYVLKSHLIKIRYPCNETILKPYKYALAGVPGTIPIL